MPPVSSITSITKVAKRSPEVMLEAVRPGGKSSIANFTPAVTQLGYMEAFMDWFLHLSHEGRARGAVRPVICARQFASLELCEDPHGNIAFATVTRA